MSSSGHVDKLWLAYLEGLLSPEERSEFEEHIHNCSECESKVEETRRWASLLKENPRVMCPELWEIFDQICKGNEPLGIGSSHLNECPSCREIAESFKTCRSKQGMPNELWARMTELSGETLAHRPPPSGPGLLTRAVDRLLDLIRPIALVPAAVAIGILFLVIFYPTHPTQRTLALSSVNWAADSSGLGLMGKEPPETPSTEAHKNRLAIVVFLTNFKHPPDQNQIDDFYRSIEPPIDIRTRYDVVSPAELKRTIAPDALKSAEDESIAAEMTSKLGISRLLVLDISQSGKGFAIRARLRDTTTGSFLKEQGSENLTEAQIIPVLEKMTGSMLEHQGNGP